MRNALTTPCECSLWVIFVHGLSAHHCCSPEVAAEVEREGMVELVLAQCQVDDHSPLAREWGLFAVRNLCEVSAGIRDRISNLKVTHGE